MRGLFQALVGSQKAAGPAPGKHGPHSVPVAPVWTRTRVPSCSMAFTPGLSGRFQDSFSSRAGRDSSYRQTTFVDLSMNGLTGCPHIVAGRAAGRGVCGLCVAGFPRPWDVAARGGDRPRVDMFEELPGSFSVTAVPPDVLHSVIST